MTEIDTETVYVFPHLSRTETERERVTETATETLCVSVSVSVSVSVCVCVNQPRVRPYALPAAAAAKYLSRNSQMSFSVRCGAHTKADI